MKFGIIGLGRIGGNLARHALELGYEVVGYAPSERERAALAAAVRTAPVVSAETASASTLAISR